MVVDHIFETITEHTDFRVFWIDFALGAGSMAFAIAVSFGVYETAAAANPVPWLVAVGGIIGAIALAYLCYGVYLLANAGQEQDQQQTAADRYVAGETDIRGLEAGLEREMSSEELELEK